MDSHLKAYERAQQMLKDLVSEMTSKGGGDRVEQSRLIDVFLGKLSKTDLFYIFCLLHSSVEIEINICIWFVSAWRELIPDLRVVVV